MKYWDMPVETPVRLTDLEDHVERHGNAHESQCSDCGKGPLRPWYPLEEVSAVRHWNVDSLNEPGGGHWTWYCPDHLERRNGEWWRSSHLAPAQLVPEETHYCSQDLGLRKTCGEVAVECFDGAWRCEEHSAAERMNRRIAALLSDDPAEAQ
jgi:hypothetical protein